MTLVETSESEATELQVYKAIRRALMSGALEPGARISSRSIAESLGVSAMPVREALKRLEADGVVESQPKRGYVVQQLSVEELQEILKIRLHLEGMLVREAAKKITPAAVSKIRKLEQRVAEAPDLPTSLALNYQMHFEAYRWANMPIALSMIENVWLRLGPALYHLGGEYTGATAHESHAKMVEGLAKGDADVAEKGLRNDLVNAAKVMEKSLRQVSRHQG